MDTRGLLFAAWCSLTPTFVASAAQYFVSPIGDDTAPGSSAAPWKTLQHAADAVGPGDRVTVRPGSYAGFHLTTSGTAAAPIEFVAEPNVVVNQPNPVRSQHGINLENASYVIVDGFSVTGMQRAGIRSVGVNGNTFASHVTIRNSQSYNNGYWGILTGFVHDLLIENNVTYGSVNEHGIYVSNSGDRPIIRRNVSFNNNSNGIHMNGDVTLGGDGIISEALVSGNVIYNNGATGGGSGINMDGVQNSRIENNLLYNNHRSGISLYRIDGGGGASNNIVANNTVVQSSNALWALNIQDGSTGNTVRNNILLNNHSFRGAIDISPDSMSGFSSDYNAVISRFTQDGGDSVQSLAQWQTATGQDTHSFVSPASALFVNPTGNDYHLKSGAPAINTGTPFVAPPADLDGRPRPAAGAYDIGAFEFGAIFGDYTRDGHVDAADYVLWRESLGLAVTRFAGADGSGNGIVDQLDYARWRGGFGGATGAGITTALAAVPEVPVAPLVLSMVVLLSRRRRMFSGL